MVPNRSAAVDLVQGMPPVITFYRTIGLFLHLPVPPNTEIAEQGGHETKKRLKNSVLSGNRLKMWTWWTLLIKVIYSISTKKSWSGNSEQENVGIRIRRVLNWLLLLWNKAFVLIKMLLSSWFCCLQFPVSLVDLTRYVVLVHKQKVYKSTNV